MGKVAVTHFEQKRLLASQTKPERFFYAVPLVLFLGQMITDLADLPIRFRPGLSEASETSCCLSRKHPEPFLHCRGRKRRQGFVPSASDVIQAMPFWMGERRGAGGGLSVYFRIMMPPECAQPNATNSQLM